MSQENIIPSDTAKGTLRDLWKILEEYARISFNGTYGIEFKGDHTQPTDFFPSDSRKLSSVSGAVVIKDDGWNEIEKIIQFLITAQLNIPVWLEDSIKADLKEQFLAIKKVAEESAIKSTKYSKTYPDPLIRPLFWKSLGILTFTRKVSGGVGETYIHFLGVFYPLKPDIPATAPEEGFLVLE